MKISPPWRTSQGQKKLYCIYCNEELGVDPDRCIYCGSSRSNPLMATSEVRHDLKDRVGPVFAPKQVSAKRMAIRLVGAMALGAALPPSGSIGADLRMAAVLVGITLVCAASVTVARCWATRTGRWDRTTFGAFSDGFQVVVPLAYLLLTFRASRGADVTSCYGKCTGHVAGIAASTLAMAAVALLGVIAFTVFVAVTRMRAGTRVATAAGQSVVTQGVPGAARGSLPASDPWGVTSKEREVQATRR